MITEGQVDGIEIPITETDSPILMEKFRTPSLEVLIEMNGMRSEEAGSLIKRAIAVGYKNRLPKKPYVSKSEHVLNKEGHHAARMSGYNKRMSNWLRGLVVVEIEKGAL